MNTWSLFLTCLFFVAVFGSTFASEIGASGTALLTKMFNSEDSLESVLASTQAELIAFEEMEKILKASFDILSVPALAQEESILAEFSRAANHFAAYGSADDFSMPNNPYPLHHVIVLEYFATLYVYHQEMFPHINRPFLLRFIKSSNIGFDACIAQSGRKRALTYYKRLLLVLIYSGERSLFSRVLEAIHRRLSLNEKAIFLDAYISQAAFKNFPNLEAFERGLLYLSTVFDDLALWNADRLTSNSVIKSEAAKLVISRICHVKAFLPEI